MITEREKFLMRQAMNAAEDYKDLESWLSDVICDAGYTVEQHLDHDASRVAYQGGE